MGIYHTLFIYFYLLNTCIWIVCLTSKTAYKLSSIYAIRHHKEIYNIRQIHTGAKQRPCNRTVWSGTKICYALMRLGCVSLITLCPRRPSHTFITPWVAQRQIASLNLGITRHLLEIMWSFWEKHIFFWISQFYKFFQL